METIFYAENHGKHKVFNILGLKIKLKRKPNLNDYLRLQLELKTDYNNKIENIKQQLTANHEYQSKIINVLHIKTIIKICSILRHYNYCINKKSMLKLTYEKGN